MYLSQWILLTMVRFYLFSLGLILGKLVPFSQVSSNIETLNHSTLHLVWKEAPQAGRQQKFSKWSLKLIRFTRLLPCQRAIKAERLLRWKEAELQRRLSKEPPSYQLSGRSLDQLRYLEKTFSKPLRHLQAVQFLQVPSFCELSPMLCRLCWCRCFLSHFCSCK